MIEAINLKKKFKLYKRPSDRLKEIIFRKPYHTVYESLKGVSFKVENGEILGIIGPNGAGKSTVLKILTGVIIPDEGKVNISGKITGLLELGTGFNFDMTGIENIYLNGTLLGMTKEELDRKLNDIISFSELEDFIYEPIRTYSSGMVMRLAFSIAIHANPDCFVVDEALAVGDAHFQQKCIRRIREFKESGGSIIFVSHDMNAVKMLCDKAILLYKGEVLDEGTPDRVISSYNYLLAKIGGEGEKVIQYNNKGSCEYGSYEIHVENVEIKGGMSKSNIVLSGEDMEVSVLVKAKENIEDFTVGILIRDKFGIDIFGINTSLMEKKLSIRKNEEKEIIFKFPANLSPGKYTLTVALHQGKSHDEKCFHWIDNIASFEVSGYKYYPFAGLVYLPPTLTIKNH